MNILLIFTDQMHKYALGKLSDYVITPNLDKLCEEGVLFTNCYSNSPICGPFRGNLISGMLTKYNGVLHNCDYLNDGIPTIADSFNKGGYNTSFVGKWHLGGNGNAPIPQNIQADFKYFMGYQCYNGFNNDICFHDQDENMHTFEGHRTDITTDLAINKIKELSKLDKPFFQIIGYQAPHYPVQPSEEYVKLYENKTIPTTVDYIDIDPYTPTFSPKSPRPFSDCPDHKRYGNNMQEYLRLYYGMVTQIDYNIGRILRTLNELNIDNDTVVIFTSDHGDMQGSHGEKNKTLPYEKSCGIPLIVTVPNGRKNTICNSLVSAIDLFPTCLDYAKLPHENHLQGHSFAPYTSNFDQVIDWPIYSEIYNNTMNWKMVRMNNFKLTVNWDTRTPIMLYNLKSDPFEMNNLVHNTDYQYILDELSEMLLFFDS